MVVVRGYRGLEQAPGLVDAQHADDVGSPRTAEVIGAIHTAREAGRGEVDAFHKLVW